MAHSSIQPENLSPRELAYQDYMQRGDDFFKIEILRPAKAWYSRALEMYPESAEAINKIEECTRLLKYERKVFSILGIIGITILLVLLII